MLNGEGGVGGAEMGDLSLQVPGSKAPTPTHGMAWRGVIPWSRGSFCRRALGVWSAGLASQEQHQQHRVQSKLIRVLFYKTLR